MAAEQVALGDRCFVEEDYDAAISHYSKALTIEPSASAYAARANAYIKQEHYVEAAQDANKAIELDPGHAKAYLRKGVAFYYLEEYESALEALQQGAALRPDAAQYQTWIRKCKAEIEDEGGAIPPSTTARAAAAAPAAASAPAATPHAVPSSSAPAATTAPSSAPASSQQHSAASIAPAGTATAASSSSAAAAPEPTGKYRYQWYQIQQKVVVDVYAKSIPRERIEASTDGKRLRIAIKVDPAADPTAAAAAAAGGQVLPEGYEYLLEQELYAEVVPSSLRVDAGRVKIEVAMAKADPAISWATLHKSGTVAAPNWSVPQDPSAARQYPSSFRNPKDWSTVEGELKEMEQKGELEDGDPLQNFFKSIFSQGDEDTRRAMMKSFVESNGTVLSTNWKEVGAKKVECTPPQGMEVHKWSENM